MKTDISELSTEGEELKDCPFCGHRPKMGIPVNDDDKDYIIYCPSCGCQVGKFPDKADAIKAWNQRKGE